MGRKISYITAEKLYEGLSAGTKEKLSDRFDKALLCEENIEKYCDDLSFPVAAKKGSIGAAVSTIDNHTRRLTESSSKFLSSSKEYYKNTLAFASLKGIKNSVFNKEYYNQATQREELIDALHIVDCHISFNDYVNDTIASVDKENAKVPDILNEIEAQSNKNAIDRILPNSEDVRKAKKTAKIIQNKKALFPTIMMWLFILATVASGAYLYFHRNFYPFVCFCACAGLSLLFFIITLAVRCKYSKDGLQRALLEYWVVKWKNNVKDSGAARKTIAYKRRLFTQMYDEALSEWESNKKFVRNLVNKFNSQLFVLDTDFLNSIPEEFRSLSDIRMITSYLRSYKTDTLSETYALIERKRKEEEKEAEERSYKEQKLALERMNLSIAQKNLGFTRLQAEYSKCQLEYNKVQNKNFRQQIEYSKQQTELAKQQVEYAKQQLELDEEFYEYYD